MPDPSDMVAESIVMDHKKSIMMGYEPGVAEPGLDWVTGAFDNDQDGRAIFAAQHSAVITELERLQLNWFKILVRLADDNWNQYHMHKFVTELQRTAAAKLNLMNKEWMLEAEIERALSRCKFCFSNIHPEAIICYSCHGDQRLGEYKNVSGVETRQELAK